MARELQRARSAAGADAEEEAEVTVDEGRLEGAGIGGRGERDGSRVAEERCWRDEGRMREARSRLGAPDGCAATKITISLPVFGLKDLSPAHLIALSSTCNPIAFESAIAYP